MRRISKRGEIAMNKYFKEVMSILFLGICFLDLGASLQYHRKGRIQEASYYAEISMLFLLMSWSVRDEK